MYGSNVRCRPQRDDSVAYRFSDEPLAVYSGTTADQDSAALLPPRTWMLSLEYHW